MGIDEAARRMGCSTQSLYRWLKAGLLEGTKVRETERFGSWRYDFTIDQLMECERRLPSSSNYFVRERGGRRDVA